MKFRSGARRLRLPAMWLLLLAGMAALVLCPQEAAEAARSGLTLCVETIIPAMFPFFVLSSLAVEFGLADWLGRRMQGLMGPVFGLSGACSGPLMLGFVGGYPVGARCTVSLYERGTITREEAERLLGFCNNCGPAFILSVAGAGVFGSTALGGMLLVIHVVSALLTGLLLCPRGKRSRAVRQPVLGSESAPLSVAAAFSSTVKTAFFSTLSVCAYVIFFAVVVQLLETVGILSALSVGLSLVLQPLGLGRTACQAVLSGLLEVTGGVAALGSITGDADLRLCLCALLLGWGGLSVHCQAMSFLLPAGLRAAPYLKGKCLQAGLSFVLTLGVTALTAPQTVFAAAAPSVPGGLSTGVCAAVGAGVMVVWLSVVGLATARNRR